MSIEKIKKFVKDHKKEIIYSVAIGAAGLVLGAAGCKAYHDRELKELKATDNGWFIQLCEDIDEAKQGCNAYTLATPKELFSAYSIDANGDLIGHVKDPDGRLMNPKMLMVFGKELEK